MPSALNNMQFPQGYSPWYVYRADLKDSTQFDRFDFLVVDDGKFKPATDNAVVVNGYVVALEQFKPGMTTLQVASPGSLIPAIAGAAIQPESLLKIKIDNSDIKLVPASAADLAAGKVVGRYRNHNNAHTKLKAAAKGDIIHVLTGAI